MDAQSSLPLILENAPDGMQVDIKTGLVTWQPMAQSPAKVDVRLHAFDSRGGSAVQAFTVQVAGGNHLPVIEALDPEIYGAEGQPLTIQLAVTDQDSDPLVSWVENLPPGPLRALRALGAGRVPLALVGVYPAALPRFLLYFFYRWETCVREATVLGMLGIVSLGYWIDDARHRFRYDEMVFWILAGAAIVLLGDLLSAVVRRWLRRAP